MESETLEVRDGRKPLTASISVALGHYVWHVESTGREWESDFAHVFTVRDGKLTGFQEYANTAAIADAFREG